MADALEKTASVYDGLKAGFQAAMVRVEERNLPENTMVDLIPQDEWTAWDKTEENPAIIDSDGLDGLDFDDDCLPHAA